MVTQPPGLREAALRYLWIWAQLNSEFARHMAAIFPRLDWMPVGPRIELRCWDGDRMLRVFCDGYPGPTPALVIRIERPLSRQSDQTTLPIPRQDMARALLAKDIAHDRPA